MLRPGDPAPAGARSTARSAFTLIELLSVVAILAVLAALLLPVISRARAWTNQARCAANLKQLFIAVQNYASDHDGSIPSADFGPSDNEGGPMDNWLVALLPYTKVSSWETDNVFACPAARKEYKANIFTPTYGYNSGLRTVNAPKSESQIRMVNIHSSTRTCLIMDGKNAWEGQSSPPSAYWNWRVYGNPGSHPTPRDFVHNSKANVLFCDGHIELLAAEEIPTLDSELFWNPRGN
jgi:general secretion pathway protein G